MRRTSKSRDYRKILVIRFSSLGDIVLTTPVLTALRKRYPNAKIDYLLKEQYAPLLEYHPSGCEIVPLPEAIRKDATAFVKFAESLRGREYDLVVDLQGNARSMVVRKRVFIDSVKVRKDTLQRLALVKFGLGKDRRPDIRKRYFRTLRRLGIDSVPPPVSLAFTDNELSVARNKFLGDIADDTSRLVAIHPEARWPLKEWGRQRYSELATLLVEKGYRVLMFGERVETDPESGIIFALDTDLRELIVLIADSGIFVGNDSGPLHIAEAVKTPAVGIFGPTHQALGYAPTWPGSKSLGVNLACRPCTLYGQGRCRMASKLCMERISVEEVANAVDAQFEWGRINARR